MRQPQIPPLSDGASLLHVYAAGGYRAQVESLLQAGHPADVADNSGAGPIHWAAQAGHESIVEVLLAHGADVNANSPQEGVITPLLLAAAGGHLAVVRLLCFAADGSTDERCVMIDTPRTPNYVNRVTPVVAAVVRDTVWVFGLRTYGRRVEPAWASQPVGVVPVFLGRLPLRGAAPR